MSLTAHMRFTAILLLIFVGCGPEVRPGDVLYGGGGCYQVMEIGRCRALAPNDGTNSAEAQCAALRALDSENKRFDALIERRHRIMPVEIIASWERFDCR